MRSRRGPGEALRSYGFSAKTVPSGYVHHPKCRDDQQVEAALVRLSA
jgi:hypothetical protein